MFFGGFFPPMSNVLEVLGVLCVKVYKVKIQTAGHQRSTKRPAKKIKVRKWNQSWKNLQKVFLFSLSLLWGTTTEIMADLKPLTGAAPISSVYIYVCLGLTDTRRSNWLEWEPFGLEQHQWIIRLSSSNSQGPCVLEMNQVCSLPNHLVLGSKNHIFL